MLIRLISDIHLNNDARSYQTMHKHKEMPEYEYLWKPPVMENDSETVLVIAGDMWDENRFFVRRYGEPSSWLEQVAPRFKAIVMVLGNHDYWGSTLLDAVPDAKAGIQALGLNNVHLLERDSVVIDNVKFLGGTLWTNFDNANPISMMAASSVMRDYIYIRLGNGQYRKINTSDIYSQFDRTKKFITANAKPDNPEQKVVVVTHMAPSYESVAPMYRNESEAISNSYYYSSMEPLMLYEDGVKIDYWFHGHTHTYFDYKIGNTRVMCNPRGYPGERITFDENLTVVV